jgi:hypothetical protein
MTHVAGSGIGVLGLDVDADDVAEIIEQLEQRVFASARDVARPCRRVAA